MNGSGVNIRELQEFDNHKFVAYVNDDKAGLRGFIAIHRGDLVNPAFGATRLWSYGSETDALRDALRLSRAMSYKSALAGINYGGGKGVLLSNGQKSKKRPLLMRTYAKELNYLGGNFVTGTDVGLQQRDVKLMSGFTQFVTGLHVDPSKYTAVGLYYSIRACLKEIFGNDDIQGRSFAIQGLGKIGADILRIIYPKAKEIFVSDIDQDKIKKLKKKYRKIKVTDPNEIHKQAVDVFSPCALSSAINTDTIPQLRCRIICGGANNQLESNASGELLHKLGILYAPDYVVNAGGLISVVDEYEHKNADPERILGRIKGITDNLTQIISGSKKQHKATNLIADKMAENNIKQRFG